MRQQIYQGSLGVDKTLVKIIRQSQKLNLTGNTFYGVINTKRMMWIRIDFRLTRFYEFLSTKYL
jgi:hypothetical protein